MIFSYATVAGIIFVSASLAKPLHSPFRHGPESVKDSKLEFPVPVSVALIVCLGIVVTAVIVTITLHTSTVPDSDFVDVTANEKSDDSEYEETNVVRGKVMKNGKFVRGSDIAWVEMDVFSTAPEFFASDLAKRIEREYTVSRKRQFNYAEVIEYRCKFARKLGFQPCQRKMKVLFMSHCQEVRVESSHDCPEHNHEVDQQSLQNKASSSYRWSPKMIEYIEQCVINHGKPKVALRNMEDAGCFENIRRPSMEQLYNKMAAIKKALNKNPPMTNTFEMRQLINQYIDVPEDPDAAYVPFYEIQDENSKSLRFNIILSTSTCLARYLACFHILS